MRTHYSATAPFRDYKKTDTSVYQDGVESARAWRDHWNHLPGGPYVCKYEPGQHLADPDWIEYCENTARHNAIWKDGWHAGMRRYHPAQYKRIVGQAVYDKLAKEFA